MSDGLCSTGSRFSFRSNHEPRDLGYTGQLGEASPQRNPLENIKKVPS